MLGLSSAWALLPTLGILRGHFLGLSSGLCPLQQVRRLHLEMMSCSQLFTAMDASQVLGEL